MANICFTRAEICRIDQLIKSPDTYPEALSLAKHIHSRADDDALANGADYVIALESLIIELEYQMRNPDAIDIDPLNDSLHDCIDAFIANQYI